MTFSWGGGGNSALYKGFGLIGTFFTPNSAHFSKGSNSEVLQNSANYRNNNFKPFSPVTKCAFTLAEVLITLGIIGVVAALTLPQLIQNHKKVEVEAKLKQVYSIVNQAILEAENEHGPQEYWTCPSASVFVQTYFAPYMREYLIENKTSFEGNNTFLYLNNGSLLITKEAAGCIYDISFYPNASNFDEDKFSKKDENGNFTANREDSGKTFFLFRYGYKSNQTSNYLHYKKGFEPYKAYMSTATKKYLTSGGWYGCNSTATNKAYCAALIQLNGWKIPKDYPFKVR